MAAATVGSAVTAAGQPTIAGYIVESWNVQQGGDVQQEDIADADGAFYGALIYEKRMEKITGTLIVTTGTPATTFPEGAMCTATSYTKYFVNRCEVQNSKGPRRINVELEKIDFT